ncbi:MAG: Histidinol phosphatase of the family protein [Acidobacteria bacterium]|nr:Histidinol phosphatase of the family protein [Acidobacteriota bacterium]
MRLRPARPIARRGLAAILATSLAAAVAIGLLLPPKALILRQPEWRPAGTSWRGAFHVHTNRSDGTGTIDEVAAAAARAGLQFVVLTDHGDGTRPLEPPSYRSGVLVIDGVEVSTTAGHYAAVGMRRAPYPLGGEARDVVEDVARLGGFGVITHPDSPKGGQPWRDWAAPVDGMEWLNADTQWRDESTLRLARAALAYPFRPPETLASLLNQGSLLARWDRAASVRPIVALAGADAHARIGLEPTTREPYEGRALLRVPSYEASFRAFSLQLVTAGPPSGRAADDAARVIEALRAGRVHTVIDGWASPAVFEFTAKGGGQEAHEGGELATGEPVVLRVRSNAPLYAALVLLRDGEEIQRVDRQSLVYATDRRGRYRVEVWLGRPGARPPIPWLVSNAITLREPAPGGAGSGEAEGAGPRPAGAAEVSRPGGGAAGEQVSGPWHVEHDPRSGGEVAEGKDRGEIVLRFRLGGGRPSGQFAALVAPIRVGGASALVFEARAAQPMRVSVQLRAPAGREGERWHRSVYLDETPRQVRIRLADMAPAGPTTSATPSRAVVDNLLFVVDTVNTAPGSVGTFEIARVRPEPGSPHPGKY